MTRRCHGRLAGRRPSSPVAAGVATRRSIRCSVRLRRNGSARARVGEASEATDEYVRENPWAAIGIAAAIGIVIGFVAGRR